MCLCLSRTLACNFIFCVLSLPGLVLRWWWLQRMSLEVFLCNLLQYRCFKRIGVNPSLNVLYNSPVKLSGHGHWLLGVFKSQFQFQYLWFIGSYFLFHILFQFIFSISSWFSLGRLYSSKILSMSSRLSILLVYNCLYSVMIFCISVLSFVASFLKIVLIWAPSLFSSLIWLKF